jgi:hypothetical protein
MKDDLYTQPATMWFSTDKALKELLDLGFAFAALADQCGTPGSFQREMAANASVGVKRRIAYLYDSLVRLFPPEINK